MASIILSTAGAAIGQSTGGPIGAAIGSRIGKMVGGFVDDRLFGRDVKLKDREGPRLADLAVQTSTYGRMIPIVYGTARIAGNIIWAQPIRETVTTSTASASAGGGGKGGGGGRITQTSTTYSYSVSLAVAICEGPVDEVMRVWADAKLLDLSQYTLRVYTGGEDQLADTLISGVEGAGNTPAHRGLAYIVLEDFPLADFGNRIPNFTFEVKKRAQHADFAGETLEEMITAITLIPGAGEFVYDTQVEYKIPGLQTGGGWVQQGPQSRLNMHNASGQANALLSLDQLEKTCPNIEWVSVVISWFGDSLDAGDCVVLPGVEYQEGAITSPDTWGVAGYSRGTARQITLEEGSPRYGGTPGDSSVLRLIDELKLRGYKVMIYPMMFMDVDGKPWRGEVTGNAGEVANFFTKTNGYNAFVMHYANLTATRADAFVIGSELKGLTKVTDTPGSYPAVDQLVALAASVKAVFDAVPRDVKVTYAADWSEYHHTDGGWYHMDPLWASPDIDVIGIDAYFPLSDAPQGAYDAQALIDGWTQGEGYEFYYSDPERTVQSALSAPYAWKNIAWFWENAHTNPDASGTDWVPESKPIWFTEYGFPSVDGAANQPNVFYDPATESSAFPYFSKGRVDFRAQRTALTATEAKWQGSSMVEQKFVWTWDARPYPYWPDLTSVWADGAAWKTGHWVQGKLGISSLAAIVRDLCLRVGLSTGDIDVSMITDQVEGFVVTGQQSVRGAVEQLQRGYFFDAVESGNQLKFIPRGGASVLSVPAGELIPQQNNGQSELLGISRQQEVELPKRINVVYLSRIANYQPATQYAQREVTESKQLTTLDLPLVFSDQSARIVADVSLYSAWISRTGYRFHVGVKHSMIEPADVITVETDEAEHQMRVTSVSFQAPGLLRIDAVAEDVSAYDFYTSPGDVPTGTGNVQPVAETNAALLDIPALPGDAADAAALRIAGAGSGENWHGAVLYRSEDGGVNYALLADITTAAVMGSAVTALPAGPQCVFDEAGTVEVVLRTGELSSASEIAVLNGVNAAILGDEIIQFRNATLLAPSYYRLSGLLRGRMGTEWALSTHADGERFVLLDGRVVRQNMPVSLLGLSRLYKPVSAGSTIAATNAQAFTHTGVCFRPYAPVHIRATRDGSGNISLSWVRRSRAGGEWADYVDVPLNETAEAYEVDIMNGGSVVRTISPLASPAASYSAGQQTADFGATQSSLGVRVYQLSSVIGRGYKGEAVV